MVYNHMNRDTSDLLDSLRNDPSTRPPFFWHHIRPERQRWGIVEIWRNAGPVTRPLFDRGATNGEYGPNWVTGWLLYSVFRSRDVRNNRNRRRGDDGSSGGMLYYHPSSILCCAGMLIQSLASGPGSAKGAGRTASGNVQQAKKGYYDPVRNGTH